MSEHMTRSSGNVFADLGLPHAEELLNAADDAIAKGLGVTEFTMQAQTIRAAMPPLATPADDRPALTARPVCCEADALLMGEIRHTQRAGFSNDNTPIDPDRQRDWWHAWRNRINAYLYYDGAALVGYGCLIQRMDGTWVSSCAVLPEHEGRGHGKRILSHLIHSVDHAVYAQARTDNPAACSLHHPSEWEITDQTHHLIFFRTWPKIRTEYPVTLGGYE